MLGLKATQQLGICRIHDGVYFQTRNVAAPQARARRRRVRRVRVRINQRGQRVAVSRLDAAILRLQDALGRHQHVVIERRRVAAPCDEQLVQQRMLLRNARRHGHGTQTCAVGGGTGVGGTLVDVVANARFELVRRGTVEYSQEGIA